MVRIHTALFDGGLERLLLDRENDLGFLDFVAVLEQAGTEKALHARPQIGLFQRLGAPDELWTSTAIPTAAPAPPAAARPAAR